MFELDWNVGSGMFVNCPSSPTKNILYCGERKKWKKKL